MKPNKNYPLSISANSKAVIVTNNETDEIVKFPFISSFAKFINLDESYIHKCINNKPCENYTIVKKLVYMILILFYIIL